MGGPPWRERPRGAGGSRRPGVAGGPRDGAGRGPAGRLRLPPPPGPGLPARCGPSRPTSLLAVHPAPAARPPEAVIPPQSTPPTGAATGTGPGSGTSRGSAQPAGGNAGGQGDGGRGGVGRRYADAWLAEDPVLAGARARAAEAGVVPVSPGAGAALSFLAAVTGARAVIEIGTGTGVSGTWLLRGMRPEGVLTSIDARGDHQQVARQVFREAGFPTPRTRLIAGQALQVLPRLSDGAYDLFLCSAGAAETVDYVEEAVRLLRTGGVLAVDNALWGDRVADPSARDPETVAVREVGRALRDDPRLVPALLPIGDGLVVAVKA